MQRYSMGSGSVSLAVASIGLSMCLVCELGADEVNDHRVKVKISKTVTGGDLTPLLVPG